MFNFDLAFNCVKPVVKILDDETSGIDNRKYVGLYRKHFQSEYDNLNQIIEGIPVQRF
jgi:hypothetical protein